MRGYQTWGRADGEVDTSKRLRAGAKLPEVVVSQRPRGLAVAVDCGGSCGLDS